MGDHTTTEPPGPEHFQEKWHPGSQHLGNESNQTDPSLLKLHAEHISSDQFLIPTPVTPDGEAGDLYKIK